tara:strand:+ start:2280 stop:2519 length:240 start_codon:yes stop_codon:yes gene_type:complete
MEYFSKSRLKNNVSYFGVNERTAVARWDAKEECFWYISLAYTRPTMVRLMHPDDGGSFKPIAELLGRGDVNTTTNGVGI